MNASICARCGRLIPPDAPRGRCPACVVASVLAVVGETDAAPRPDVAPSPDGSGARRTRLGGYELFEELGRGGMGIVYRARQLEAGRDVALKVLDVGFAPPGDAGERFLREARVVASLQHPGIVRLYDAGSAEGHRYFAMELVAGQSLEARAREGPLPAADAARCLAKVAQAIAYAHEQQVVHRDLKPSNIILDPHGEPRVTDFGLARRLDAPGLTATRQSLGTPAYVAPEQVRAAKAHPDPRSDVYSLGAILYRLITGRPPFQGETIEALLLQVVESEPVPVRRLNPSVPRDLEAICLKCLEKAPARRYPTAAALAEDLERFLDNAPVRARSITPLYRLCRHCRRRPWIAALSGALALAVLAGGAGILWHSRQTKVAQRETERANVHLHDLVSRGRLERAEDFMRRGEPRAALPHLARIVRDDPDHPAAPSRILNLLSERHQLLPLRPPLTVTSNLNFARLSPTGRLVALATWERHAQVMDLEAGRPATPPLRHEKSVLRVAFSPDERWLASTSPDGTARVWNTTHGEPVCPPLEHRGNVLYLAFSPDGRRLVTTCEILESNALPVSEVALWELPSGRRSLPVHTNRYSFHAVAFSPDGRWVAAASTDRHAHVLDAATGRAVGLLPHESAVTCLAFSPDSQRLATGCHGREARLWELRTLAPLGPPLRHGDLVNAVQFSPDGQFLLTASGDGLARVFDVATGQLRLSPLPAGSPVRSAHFDREGNRVVAHGDDGALQTWDARTGQAWNQPIKHTAPLLLAEFTANGERLVTVGQDGLIQVRDARPGARSPVRLVHDEPVLNAAFGPGALEVVTVSQHHPFARWSALTGERLALAPRQSRSIVGALFNPHGDRVLVRQTNFTADLWSAQVLAPLRAGLVLAEAETNAVFSPDGRWLALKQSGWLEVFDAVTGTAPPHRLQTAIQASHSVGLEFSPDGRFLFHDELWMGGRLWQFAATPEAGPEIPAYSAPRAARFSPDSRYLATAGPDHRARLYHVATTAPAGPELPHPHFPHDLCFTPDGATLITAARDHSVRAWNPVTGELRLPIMHPPGNVKHLEVSADGQSLLIVSDGGHVTMWDLNTGRQRFPSLRVEGGLLLAQFLRNDPASKGARSDTAGAATPFTRPSGTLSRRTGEGRGEGTQAATLPQPWITIALDGTAGVRDTATGLPLTDLMIHGAPIHHAEVSPDGSRLLMAGEDHRVSVWELFIAPAPAPPWLADLAEALAGERLDELDTSHPVPATAAYDLRARLGEASGDDGYLRWARWFFRDRAASPEPPVR